MNQSPSVAASLPPTARKSLAIEVLTKTKPISHLAIQHQVSRKFLYQQRQKAEEVLDEVLNPLQPQVLKVKLPKLPQVLIPI